MNKKNVRPKIRRASLFLKLFNLRKKKQGSNIFEEELVMSPTRLAIQTFASNRLAMFSTILFLIIFVLCMILPSIYPMDVRSTNATLQDYPPCSNFTDLPKAMRKNPKKIAVGSGFGIGIDANGKVHIWGQLNDKQRKIPKSIARSKALDVAAGANHLVALGTDGKIYPWGNDEFNLNVPPPEADYETPVRVYANYLYSAYLSEEKKIHNWGNDLVTSLIPDYVEDDVKEAYFNSNTGIALTTNKKLVPMTKQAFAFTAIPEDIQGKVVTAALTNEQMYAVTEDGKLHSWGNPDKDTYVPCPKNLDGKIKKMASGEFFVVALLKDGTLKAWGDNTLGQLDVPSGKFKEVYAGYHNGYAVRENGDVVAFGPSGFRMGTDDLGRDIFRRILQGGRMTMTVGAIAVIISALIGIAIGGISGFYSGAVDVFLMRLAEVVNSIPFLPLAMILSGILGNKISENQRIILIMFILGILTWPHLARLTRAQILSERKKEFVTAANALGIKESVIIFKHILPNVINVVLVNITLGFATCMLTESSLSFLGFGVQPPQPTWGNMLTGCQSSQVIGTFWWRWVFPSGILALCTISINSIGDGLRDAIDPKSNER